MKETFDDGPCELFAIPFGCSLAAHIALRERQIDHQLRWVTLSRHSLEDGSDFRQISPKGKVSVLRLSDGTTVTENCAVLLTIAELGSGALALPKEWRQRVQLIEWLSFVATELHKQVLRPCFDPNSPEQTRGDVIERLLPPVLRHVEESLANKPYLLGDDVSVADAYLFWATVLLPHAGAKLDGYPHLGQFHERLLGRASVRQAMAIEQQQRTEGQAS